MAHDNKQKNREQKKTVVFLSPHLDDAVLSAGVTMWKLINLLGVQVIVVNVFTHYEDTEHPDDASAQQALRHQFLNGRDRRVEDRAALLAAGLKGGVYDWWSSSAPKGIYDEQVIHKAQGTDGDQFSEQFSNDLSTGESFSLGLREKEMMMREPHRTGNQTGITKVIAAWIKDGSALLKSQAKNSGCAANTLGCLSGALLPRGRAEQDSRIAAFVQQVEGIANTLAEVLVNIRGGERHVSAVVTAAGIGGHPDHWMARFAAEKTLAEFPDVQFSFYQDFPYHQTFGINGLRTRY